MAATPNILQWLAFVVLQIKGSVHERAYARFECFTLRLYRDLR